MERLEEAFNFERSIEQSVYERQRDKVRQDLTIAELELDDARMDQWDVEGVLAFAERLITNVGSIWLEATLSQRQQIQRAIFPNGIPFDGRSFGTAETCLLFKQLQVSGGVGNGLASPPGFEPGF